MNQNVWYESTPVRLLCLAALVAAFGLLSAQNPSFDDLVRTILPSLVGYFFGTRKPE